MIVRMERSLNMEDWRRLGFWHPFCQGRRRDGLRLCGSKGYKFACVKFRLLSIYRELRPLAAHSENVRQRKRRDTQSVIDGHGCKVYGV